jgi:hypothetical protein
MTWAGAGLRALLCGAALAEALATPAAAAVAAASAAATNSSNGHDFGVLGPPPGFDDLANPREVLVDVYFGGRKVGGAVAIARPGFLQFRDPAKVAALVPNLAAATGLADALSGDLPTHGALACAQSNRQDCGKLPLDSAGIIFDESRFRVDLFVPPAMLRIVPVTESRYLDVPGGPLSLTSSVGLAISGSQGQSPSYNIQDRAIVAFGPGRVRTDVAYASKQGLVVDDLVAELDRHDLRYSAGLFWAPGLDLTGRRRIVGAGFGTQFDTRADRESLTGTPLILFLSQPSRVDFLIDGRLAGSRSYDTGNNILDTSSLPEGSYPILLRVHGADGTDREERRFFVKSPQIAPAGQTLYFAYAGMLANTRPDRLIGVSSTFYYQAGIARRLSQPLALDLSIVGTQHKSMAEAGAWLITPVAQVRAAGLVSTVGDAAVLLQGTSSGRGPFNFAFDLRRIWSRDDRPLIPLPSFIDSFGGGQPTGAQLGGSYTQASATLGYRIGAAYLSVIGSLRKDAGRRSDYSIGPSFTWPIVNLNGLQLTVQADAQRTRTTTAAFAGIRLLYTANRVSLQGSAGYGSIDNRDDSGQSKGRALGGLSATYFYEGDDRTQASAAAGIERSLDSTVAHAGGTLYSRFGNVRADVLDSLEGRGGIQYGVTLQSAVAASGGEIGLGSRDLDDSAVIVEVAGEAGKSSFQVLVNGMAYGHVHAGGQLPIHLQPYRAYEISVRPDDAAAVSFDTEAKKVTLYPGSVRVVRWTAHAFFTAFGQAVAPDGSPIADAMVQAPRSVGETDKSGYFQIDAANGDSVAFTRGSSRCEIRLEGAAARNDFVSLGKVICK